MPGEKVAGNRRIELVRQATGKLPVVNIGFEVVALQFGGETLESGAIAGAVGITRDEETIIARGGKCSSNGERGDQTGGRAGKRHVISCDES